MCAHGVPLTSSETRGTSASAACQTPEGDVHARLAGSPADRSRLSSPWLQGPSSCRSAPSGRANSHGSCLTRETASCGSEEKRGTSASGVPAAAAVSPLGCRPPERGLLGSGRPDTCLWERQSPRESRFCEDMLGQAEPDHRKMPGNLGSGGSRQSGIGDRKMKEPALKEVRWKTRTCEGRNLVANL